MGQNLSFFYVERNFLFDIKFTAFNEMELDVNSKKKVAIVSLLSYIQSIG